MEVSDNDSDTEYSGIDEPPLTDLLKSILDQYPNNGQIIKELVQNAEDAKADCMKILYDRRSINQSVPNKELIYNKFFQGPALCVYNNATFNQRDWEGIKMIQKSIKKEDPMKVGRFGLGFKSVFHWTDYVCIISGEKIVFMDPHQPKSKVFATKLLSTLTQSSRLDIQCLLSALDGAFGFSEEILRSGNFPGTIFWFPLRQIGTLLSDSVYKGDEIDILFQSFTHEASHCLMFLSHLRNIELFERSDSSSSNLQPYFSISAEAGPDLAQEGNTSFLSSIESLKDNISERSIKSVTHLAVKTSENDEVQKWLVVKYFKGRPMSENLASLIKNKHLSYSPCVGITACLNPVDTYFKGHVFCFLPLPIPEDHQSDSMSKLPVHVNGFFALSQNRAQLKWPTSEQRNDKASEWNRCLITEAVHEAYLILLDQLISECQASGNRMQEEVGRIYRSIPDIDKVTDKWRLMVQSFIPKLVKKPFIFTEANGGQLVRAQDAIFATFEDCSVPVDIQKSVHKVIKEYNMKFADVPHHVMTILRNEGLVSQITSMKLSEALKRSPDVYRALLPKDKMNILAYLISDNVDSIRDLELLPLENGSFATFNSNPVSLVTTEELELFQRLGHKLTCYTKLPFSLDQKLCTREITDRFPLRKLDLTSFASLLQETLRTTMGTSSPISNVSVAEMPWIEKVWTYIFKNFSSSITTFKDIPLVPVDEGNNKYSLHCLSSMIVVKEAPGYVNLPDGVCRALRSMGVTIIESLPIWLREILQYDFMYIPTESKIIELLGRLQPAVAAVQFNTMCQVSDRAEIVNFLGNRHNLNYTSAQSLLRKCKIFHSKSTASGISSAISLDELNQMLEEESFPIPYPCPFLVCDPNSTERELAKCLGVEIVTHVDLILQTLQTFHSSSDTEKIAFMKYLLPGIHSNRYGGNVCSLAQKVNFVRVNGKMEVPANVFDPTNHEAHDLLIDQHVFPDDVEFHSGTYLSGLRMLGLHSTNPLGNAILLGIARKLDQMSRAKRRDSQIERKAKAFLRALNNAVEVYGFHKQMPTLQSLQCVLPAVNRDRGYPDVLPWFKADTHLCTPAQVSSVKFSHLIGSIKAVVECEKCPSVADYFGWTACPSIDDVLHHFEAVKQSFTSERKPKLLSVLDQIYQNLSSRPPNSVASALRNTFNIPAETASIILCNNTFAQPEKIFIREGDFIIDLAPHLYKLPEEFQSYEGLFTKLGCHNCITADVLLSVLSEIKVKHDSHGHAATDVKRDLIMIVNILNQICENIEDLEGIEDRILIPVHTGDQTRLSLKPARECTYCDAQWLRELEEDDHQDGLAYVHEDVSNQTAETLGVSSLKQLLLSDTDAFEEWGQVEPLTLRIKNLLEEGYVDGMSVPKEIFQNADDAGATELFFLYDERENQDARIKLLDDGMADCQGPALWAYNNAEFTDADLDNIQKLNAATKKEDTSKIGKFGLGFCAVYNLTDVPSFISGSNIVIFDPHMTHLGKAKQGSRPGIKVNMSKIKNQYMVKRMKNQFKPFQSVFDCDIDNAKSFNGSLFRFPLRTASQAERSEIKRLAYNRDECLKLLQMFVETAGNFLLFSQNVSSIKLFHLPATAASPREMTMVYEATKVCRSLPDTSREREEGMLTRATNLKKCNLLKTNPLREKQRVQIEVHMQEQGILSAKQIDNKTDWLVSWVTASDANSLQISATEKGAVPLACTAMMIEERKDEVKPLQIADAPFGFYRQSHMFAFLPLPIQTNLNIHINGCFAITSDRRKLLSHTEDDKYTEDSWNKCLLEEAVCLSFLQLLEIFQSENMSVTKDYVYHAFWPIDIQKDLMPFELKFYKVIGNYPDKFKVFEKNGEWFTLNQCMFLDAEIQEHPQVGQVAYDFLSYFQKDTPAVVKLPSEIVAQFEKAGSDCIQRRTLSVDEFITTTFLPNITSDYWNGEKEAEKRKMILFAIRLDRGPINASLKDTHCIPTRPNGRLRKPHELVHPTRLCSDLFSESEERFPEKSDFSSQVCLDFLEKLGMMKVKLHQELVIDRAMSVPTLAKCCTDCAIDRSECFLSYLHSKGHESLIEESLKQIAFLPVLEKPDKWIFPWRAESLERHANTESCRKSPKHRSGRNLRLARPSDVFCEKWKNVVSCSEAILNETLLKRSASYRELYQKLGVKGLANESLVDLLVSQLEMLTYTLQQNEDFECDYVTYLFTDLYKCLNIECSKGLKDELSLEYLRSKKVLFIDGKLVTPSMVAMNLKHDCSPDLFKPGHTLRSCSILLKILGIVEDFEPEVIIHLLQQKEKTYHGQRVPENDIGQICRLISVLVDSMNDKKMEFSDLKKNKIDVVYAPDEAGTLCKTTDMCFDDSSRNVGRKLIFIHPSIPENTARKLGVLTKARRSLKDNSAKIPFGQKEKLITRLQGLLNDYPCDKGIMKELVQNADDANATEIHFIKDYRTHRSESVLDESFKPLQGPALCVFNNKSFTQNDLIGIQNLGIGSKSDDATKTGQFGIGFNAVYNLTNAPSFLTKGPHVENSETLCIFDPLCKYIPDIEESDPGVRYLDLTELRATHEDVFRGYLENELFKEGHDGTVFRLPLRTEFCDLSHNVTTPDKLDRILSTFEEELCDMLLFVKNISKVTVSNISSGKLTKEYSVQVNISEENQLKREKFQEEVKKFASNKTLCLQQKCEQTGYELSVTDSNGKTRNWFVSQQIGFREPGIVTDQVKKALNDGDIGLLPHGGAAVLLNAGAKYDFKGTAFCFLPLPTLTGLPVHVHGHFALDHARRGLLDNDEGYRTEWNRHLLQNVVAPAYVAAIQFCTGSCFGKADNIYGYLEATVKQEAFEKQFPLLKKVVGKYWKWLSQCLYQTVIDTREKLFLVVQPAVNVIPVDSLNSLQEKCVSVSWIAMLEANCKYPAYFSHGHWDDATVCLLRKLGMRITCTSKDIKTAVTGSGRKTKTLSSNKVVHFLLSHRESFPDRFNLHGLGVRVEESSFQSLENVRLLLKFCFSGSKVTEDADLSGLPLIVTNDGILRELGSGTDCFLTKFCDLVPNSGSEFVHAMIVDSPLHTLPIFKPFTVPDLVRLLPYNVPMDLVGNDSPVEWLEKGPDVPNKVWLSRVWDFVGGNIARKVIKCEEALSLLSSWKLIPSVETQLHLVSRLYTFINVSSFRFDRISSALEKLHLPELDLTVTPHRYLNKCIPCKDNPKEILICLRFHKEKIAASKISVKEANDILQYFNNSIKALKKQCEDHWIRDTLKSLPIFVTQQRTAVAVDQNEEVTILPSSVPGDGIERWAYSTGRLMLKSSYYLEDVHSFLGFGIKDDFGFYLENVQSLAGILDTNEFMKHFTYLRDMINSRDYLQNSLSKQQQQQQLLHTLNATALFHIGDSLKCCRDLKNPKHPVFKVMCTDDEFPPEAYRNYDWLSFLLGIGLQDKVTGDQYIRYAGQIEDEGRSGAILSKSLKCKSLALQSSLLSENSKTLSGQYLSDLSRIKFVQPAKVDSRYTELFESFDGSSSLICYEGSVPFDVGRYFWTRVHILSDVSTPNSVCPKTTKWFFHHLRIQLAPQLEEVILHCLNIGHALKVKLPEMHKFDKKVEWIQHLMSNLYWHMNILVNKPSTDNCRTMKRRLYHAPLVYFPDVHDVLPAFMTLSSCVKSQEAAPFLRKIHKKFARYSSLFEALGAAPEPLLRQYIEVLNQLQRKVVQEALIPSESAIVGMVVENILKIMNHETAALEKHCVIDDRSPLLLFLPTREHFLVNAKGLVISENPLMEQRVQHMAPSHYFIGLQQLEIRTKYLSPIDLTKLPERYRPKLLSEITKVSFDTSSFEKIRSRRSITLENFFHSEELLIGLMRLLLLAFTDIEVSPEEDVEVEISENLQKIQAWEAVGLQTYMEIQNAEGEYLKVSGSDEDKDCYVDHSDVIYFSSNSDSHTEWKKRIEGDVAILIRKQLNWKLEFSDVYTLIDFVDCPENIEAFLDKKMNIPAYRSSRSHKQSCFPKPGSFVPCFPKPGTFVPCFPKPGTFVPVKYHPFLDNELVKFEVHEYKVIAMEIDDPGMDDDASPNVLLLDPTYIYVRIIDDVQSDNNIPDMFLQYIVDTGEEDPIMAPVYKLYRFLRKSNNVQGVSVSDNAPRPDTSVSHPYEMVFQQIRRYLTECWTRSESERRHIIKRLWLQWHPDRNHGHEEYCTEVFKYLQQCIERLEQGLPLEENDDVDGAHRRNQGADFMSTRYGAFCERMNRRSHNHHQQYEEQSHGQQHFYPDPQNHEQTAATPYPHPREGERWRRQAQLDLQDADLAMADSKNLAYNWVCYRCHQAVEKALKAAWYFKDANKLNQHGRRLSHDLEQIAFGLGPELISLSSRIINITGHHTRMRYPDSNVGGAPIPGDAFTRADAEKVVDFARQILDKLSDLYG